MRASERQALLSIVTEAGEAMLERRAVRVREIRFVQHIHISPQVAAGITERQGKRRNTERGVFLGRNTSFSMSSKLCVFSLAGAQRGEK